MVEKIIFLVFTVIALLCKKVAADALCDPNTLYKSLNGNLKVVNVSHLLELTLEASLTLNKIATELPANQTGYDALIDYFKQCSIKSIAINFTINETNQVGIYRKLISDIKNLTNFHVVYIIRFNLFTLI